MNAAQAYRKALVCCEDFLPDFVQKLAQDEVIDSDLQEDLISELFLAVFKYMGDTTDFIVE